MLSHRDGEPSELRTDDEHTRQVTSVGYVDVGEPDASDSTSTFTKSEAVGSMSRAKPPSPRMTSTTT